MLGIGLNYLGLEILRVFLVGAFLWTPSLGFAWTKQQVRLPLLDCRSSDAQLSSLQELLEKRSKAYRRYCQANSNARIKLEAIVKKRKSQKRGQESSSKWLARMESKLGAKAISENKERIKDLVFYHKQKQLFDIEQKAEMFYWRSLLKHIQFQLQVERDKAINSLSLRQKKRFAQQIATLSSMQALPPPQTEELVNVAMSEYLNLLKLEDKTKNTSPEIKKFIHADKAFQSSFSLDILSAFDELYP